MPELLLPASSDFAAADQHVVGLLVAALDDQLRRLREEVAGLEPRQLEWQERPGRNTIGMLLAHLAAVEVGWMQVVCTGRSWFRDGHAVIREHLGIESDGFPLPADGTHPASLAGRPLADYLALIDKARATTHSLMRGWRDSDLDGVFEERGHRFSRRWVLYHILEHFASHFGQISLLKHCLKDHGLLARSSPV